MKYEDIKKYENKLTKLGRKNKMIKPIKLKKGDTVAIVSLSSKLAGEILFRHRYEQRKNIF